MSPPKRCLHHHADDGGQIGVADKEAVELIVRAGDLAQGGGQEVPPEVAFDLDGGVAGVLVVERFEGRDVALVRGTVGAEVLPQWTSREGCLFSSAERA